MKFKDIIYFPSFSSGLGGYYINKAKFRDELDYRFFSDEFPEEFRYKNFLITAGHLYKKPNARADMGLEDTFVIGDSGGFQIATGALEWNKDIRSKIFNWLENNSDIAVNLDIPPRSTYEGKFNECLDISYDNFKWFNENQSGKTKFLGVIQGYNQFDQYETWYHKVKGFDFNGWCVGSGDNMSRLLYGTAVLLQNKEFENKKNQYIHYLGQTKVSDFFLYTLIQRGFDTHGMDHVQVTTDSSSPVLFPIYGVVVWDADYRKMSYISHNYKTKTDKNTKTDAMFIESADFYSKFKTPVEKYINYEVIKRYNTETRHLLAYHNLYNFLGIIKDIKGACSAHLEDLEGLTTPHFAKVAKSVLMMFDDPKNAIKIWQKHATYYKFYDGLTEIPKTVKTQKLLEDLFE